jgi:hypothetical protein
LTRFLLFPLFIFLSACGGKYPTFSGNYVRIDVGPGPEDLALDTLFGAERLIVSCDERRTDDHSRTGFYDYNIRSGELVKLAVEGLPADVALHPHGIDIGVVDSVRVLYCVNHEKNADEFPSEGRQSILVFELHSDRVVFRQQLTSDLIISPNDVCTDHQGGFYVSNDSGKRNSIWEKLFELKRSFVVHFDGQQWTQVGDKLKYANGVGVRNGRLYMTGTQEKTVISYAIQADGTCTDRQELQAIKGNDNITFSGNRLVTTAHLDFIKFLKHVKHADEPSPCAVYTIDLGTQQLDTVYVDGGETLSAASTGLIYGGNLYVAQVFNPYILKVPLSERN